MPNFTPNLNLKKPLTTEYYNIADFNDNMDIIDNTEIPKYQNKVDIISSLLGISSMAGSDAVISSNTTLSGNYVFSYNNLTVNSGITLSVDSSPTFIIVRETLTLLGTISCVGRGASAGIVADPPGSGGRGGGVLIVVANNIVGNGTISSNGENGEDAIAGTNIVDTVLGSNGSFLGVTLNRNATPHTTTTFKQTVLWPTKTLFFSGAAGGTSGRSANSGTTSRSGEGGSGIYGTGGDDSSAVYAGFHASGGGGGGGGAILLISTSEIPSINLLAKGGDGGTKGPQTYGDTGGGGGGGYVSILAPSSNAIINVQGGIGGNNGENGFSEFMQMYV